MYLQDIGTAASTEYDPSNPEFIKYLMSHPEEDDMKQGHIHSHAKMDVFFSGVDDGELRDNAQNHNFYLSLIVNNNNDMIARVCFVAECKNKIQTEMKFRNERGDFITRPVVNNTESKIVYFYDCEIEKESPVTDEFLERVKLLLNKKTAYIHEYPGNSAWEEFLNETEPKVEASKEKTSIRVYNFAVKLISLNHSTSESIEDVLGRLSERFTSKLFTDGDDVRYYTNIESRYLSFYRDSFPEDKRIAYVDDRLKGCIEIIEAYRADYPMVVQNLVETLTIIINGN